MMDIDVGAPSHELSRRLARSSFATAVGLVGAVQRKKGFGASISARALALACSFDAFRARWNALTVPYVA